MGKISFEIIKSYRFQTFCIDKKTAVRSFDDAVDFVNQRGFIFFWQIKNIVLPSLWVSVAGDRPVPSKHDDPGHITWQWKDAAIGKHYWYYAKVLRKKSTMISFDLVPFFYALSDNYGAPESDYLTLYEQGKLSHDEKVIFEILLNQGKKNTIELRRLAHLADRSSDSRFNRAIANLQADFKILPVGIAQAGSWKYAFEYALVAYTYPEIPEKASSIPDNQAKLSIGEKYISSVGASRVKDWLRLFQWTKEDVNYVINKLVDNGIVVRDVVFADKPGIWIVFKKLL